MEEPKTTEEPQEFERKPLEAARLAIRRYRRKRAARRNGRIDLRTLALVVSLIALLAVFGGALRWLAPSPTGTPISLSDFERLATKKLLKTAIFYDEDATVRGEFVCAKGTNFVESTATPCETKTAKGKTKAPVPYRLTYPRSDLATTALIQAASKAGAKVFVEPQVAKGQVRTITTFLLPLMILANMFVLLFSAGRRSSGGIGDVMVFGSIRKGVLRRKRGSDRITFADVAGAEEAVAEMQEVVDYLRSPERYEQIGALPPKGLLLIGPPGCGKTLLAKAVAGEADVPFFSVAGAEFVEALVGVGAARVRDLFQRVRAAAPAIVFIDELDAAGRRRGSGGGGGNDEREQTLNQLLVEMDGFEASSGIVVVGATNRPDILDPALLRPGRFDRQVMVDEPDRAGRLAILDLHARKRTVETNVDFDLIARRTTGFSGADLANVVNEAALLAVRDGRKELALPDLFEGVERATHGARRRGRPLTPAERARACVHESGHAIVATAVGAGTVHRVTVLGRGRALAMTNIRHDDDVEMLTASELWGRLMTAMAGLAAEVLHFGEPSTGAENDLTEATVMARDIIARYGMGSLGRARLLSPQHDALLDADIPLGDVSEQTRSAIDEEVRAALRDAEAEATALLKTQRGLLDEMSATLDHRETLEGRELGGFLGRVTPYDTAAARKRRTKRVSL